VVELHRELSITLLILSDAATAYLEKRTRGTLAIKEWQSLHMAVYPAALSKHCIDTASWSRTQVTGLEREKERENVYNPV